MDRWAVSEREPLLQDTQQELTASGKLSESPRHHEWVTLNHGNRDFEAFVVYPETKDETKAVLVIHENRDLNDWVRLFLDKLAAEGYLLLLQISSPTPRAKDGQAISKIRMLLELRFMISHRNKLL